MIIPKWLTDKRDDIMHDLRGLDWISNEQAREWRAGFDSCAQLVLRENVTVNKQYYDLLVKMNDIKKQLESRHEGSTR